MKRNEKDNYPQKKVFALRSDAIKADFSPAERLRCFLWSVIHPQAMACPVAALWRLWAVLRILCGWILPDLQAAILRQHKIFLVRILSNFFYHRIPCRASSGRVAAPVVPCGDFSPVVVHEKKFLRSHGFACGLFSGRLRAFSELWAVLRLCASWGYVRPLWSSCGANCPADLFRGPYYTSNTGGPDL